MFKQLDQNLSIDLKLKPNQIETVKIKICTLSTICFRREGDKSASVKF